MTGACEQVRCGSVQVCCEWRGGKAEFGIELTTGGCWSGLLGPWAMPGAGALDEMAEVFGGQGRGGLVRVTLSGCPSACLLPLLWVRTIWDARGEAEVVLDWRGVQAPGGERGRQAAGRLACVLADRVECDDPGLALSAWGIGVAGGGDSEEAFDLLTNIVDHWDSDLHHMTLASDWNEAVRRALANCVLLGHTRVGVYGAGTHTRAVGEALMEPGVEIVCVIDDDARRHGDRLWGYEIVSRERALGLGLDAVVISANSIEDRLWARAEVFRDAGVSVMRLYG